MATLPIGSTVWGDRGIRCQVIGAFRDIETGQIKIKVHCPTGERFISPSDIRGCEPPPRPIQVGDRVRLKNTLLTYVVNRIYPVRCGKNSDGDWDYEDYCKLTSQSGTIATWKLIQLEKIKD